MKRLMDLIVSLTVLIISLPIMVIVASVIFLGMGSPVLFKQMRPGLNGNPFYLYKFRTMTNGMNLNGKEQPDEIRLTALGKVLRKYSLDELPQFFNVLKGEMSLVGPRPLLMEYLPLYSKEQFSRHTVKPGITGWAQIHGRNAITWEEKFRLDRWYVLNRNLLLDCRILVMTVMKVIKREGINHDNSVTMEKFTGTKGVM